MKTTNLKQTSVAKPRKWFQRQRRWNDPREARPERSQFRDQPPSREATASHWRSRLHLREFAKTSRIFAAFAPGASRAPQFFFHRKSGSQNSTGIRCADTPSTKGDQDYETDTRNIAGGRSGVSIDALDSGFARSTVRSNGNSKRSAFRFLRSVLATPLHLFATSGSRFSRSAGSRPGFFCPSA
jgi:hypothetical protein